MESPDQQPKPIIQASETTNSSPVVPTATQAQPVVSTPPVITSPGSQRFKEIKNLVIKILIGCLVAAAALAVVAVLVGGLSDILWRAIVTLILVAGHAVAALTYISTSEHSEGKEELGFFSNAVFVVIILSFITSVLGTWNLLSSSIVWKLYGTYLVLLFAVLHGNMLHQSTGKTSTIDNIVKFNYLFMVIVVGMILPIIYFDTGSFDGLYYRFLSAFAIIDATLTIVAVALHRLYLNKHPKDASALFSTSPVQLDANGQQVVVQQAPKRHTNPLLILFAIYLIFQLLSAVAVGFMGGFNSI